MASHVQAADVERTQPEAFEERRNACFRRRIVGRD
jgi:hypothetical protein